MVETCYVNPQENHDLLPIVGLFRIGGEFPTAPLIPCPAASACLRVKPERAPVCVARCGVANVGGVASCFALGNLADVAQGRDFDPCEFVHQRRPIQRIPRDRGGERVRISPERVCGLSRG